MSLSKEARKEELQALYEQIEGEVKQKGRQASVGPLVKAFLVKAQLSVQAFATLSDISTAKIYRWQRNRYAPDLKELAHFRKLLGRLGTYIILPDTIPSHYFHAVADAKTPSVHLLQFLVDAERSLGFMLSEETCKALIADHEREE